MTLIKATLQPNPYLKPSDLRVYDDTFGKLFLYGEEYGPVWLIRAQSFESAWEIVIDESPTIPEDEVHEAYLDPRKDNYDYFDSAKALKVYVDDNPEQYPEIVEGYEMQSNCAGTGIVNVGHYAWMNEVSKRDFTEQHLRLRWERDD